MTAIEALNRFFNSFSVPAYPRTAVPDDTTFPWLTYDYQLGGYGDRTSASADLWYNTTSESIPQTKVDEIAAVIGLGGTLLHYDGGVIWVKKGSPWCIPVPTDDNSIKRRQLNIELEFL